MSYLLDKQLELMQDELFDHLYYKTILPINYTKDKLPERVTPFSPINVRSPADPKFYTKLRMFTK
jgi:hypothetical protein